MPLKRGHDLLKGRPGLEIQRNSRLGADLRKVASRNKLAGAVLITFTMGPKYRTEAVSVGLPGIAEEIDDLASRILAAIDDGFFEPKEIAEVSSKVQ